MRFRSSIIIIVFMLSALATQSTSVYKGVSWNKQSRKWYVQLRVKKGEKYKYGGTFKDELDAGKRVNQLCEELEIPHQNPEINAIPIQKYQKQEKTSQHKGVFWHKEIEKWYVSIHTPGGQKRKYGGNFQDELDAAKRVNELCEELGISPKNPGINGMPNEPYQKKEKMSQYRGVTWHKHRRKWYVQFKVNKEKRKGGYFNDELDAAKRVNQLCEEFGIPPQNPRIGAMPTQQSQLQKKKMSHYKGVCWHKQSGKWYVELKVNKEKKNGGYFNDELDAAKRVNQFCEELGISPQNPCIEGMPTQQPRVDNSDAKKKKRKQKQELNDDDEIHLERYYFYEKWLI